MEALLSLDGGILIWIQEHIRMAWLTPGMLFITKLGNVGIVWVILSLLMLLSKKTRWIGITGILSLITVLLFNNLLLKNLVARTRPYEVVDGLMLLTKKATDFSFPSGHAGTSFAGATAFFCMSRGKKFNWTPFVLAALIAFSRLYVGIHYPTDVICGAITGILCGILSAYIVGKVRRSVQRNSML